MNLIEKMMEPCVILNAIKVPDGQGGFHETETEGPQIMCAIVNDTSIQARVGEAQGLTSTYTITTKRTNQFRYNDLIKRVSNGDVFRITSDAADKLSPEFTKLNIAQFTAEKRRSR